jgi:chemotaxis protein MotB
MARRKPPPATHADERWLLTYADMITLLVALFIVLWAMSSVNVSKFDQLKESLSEAFSGKIHTGGGSIMETGGDAQSVKPWSQPATSAATSPNPAATVAAATGGSPESKLEQQEFRALKAELDKEIEKLGLKDKIETSIDHRGLAIKLKTDGLLFDSGSANIRPGAATVLTKVGAVLHHDIKHDLHVEGHTDNVPVGGTYPSNWELSTARASAVVRTLLGSGIKPSRFSATGFADLHPIDSNATDAGRADNRRVEIVLPRLNPEPRPETPAEAVDKMFPEIASNATEGHR